MFVALLSLLGNACVTFEPPTAAPTSPTTSPSAAPTASGTVTPSSTLSPEPTSPSPGSDLAGPPFPDPVPGQDVYDFAEILSPETESAAADLIATIEGRTGVEIVVYTQFNSDSDEDSTERDAAALIAEWAVGGADQDGMVVFWNTTRRDCQVGVLGNGQVQLYAAPGFVERLSDEERQQIFDSDMLPWLRYCDEDNGLLAALEAIDELLGVDPTPVPTPPGPATGACADDAYTLNELFWPDGYEWYFDEGSVPDKYDTDEVLEIIKRAFDNVTNALNDCGLPDNVGATWHYRGTNSEDACSQATFRNMVGFGKLKRSSGILAEMCSFGAPDEGATYAHILINSNVAWSLSQETCTGRQEDLETTLTHEVGHVFGLGHVSERKHGDLTMSTRSNGPCDTEELTLGLGDILGLEELYGSP